MFIKWDQHVHQMGSTCSSNGINMFIKWDQHVHQRAMMNGSHSCASPLRGVRATDGSRGAAGAAARPAGGTVRWLRAVCARRARGASAIRRAIPRVSARPLSCTAVVSAQGGIINALCVAVQVRLGQDHSRRPASCARLLLPPPSAPLCRRALPPGAPPRPPRAPRGPTAKVAARRGKSSAPRREANQASARRAADADGRARLRERAGHAPQHADGVALQPLHGPARPGATPSPLPTASPVAPRTVASTRSSRSAPG